MNTPKLVHLMYAVSVTSVTFEGGFLTSVTWPWLKHLGNSSFWMTIRVQVMFFGYSYDQLYHQVRDKLQSNCRVITLVFFCGFKSSMTGTVKKAFQGSSLVIQQLGICLPVRGHRFDPSSGNWDPTGQLSHNKEPAPAMNILHAATKT